MAKNRRNRNNSNWSNSVFSMNHNILIQYVYHNKCNLLILIGSLVVFGINQLPFLLDMRPVMYDEPWYMNPAFNLLHGNGLQNTLVGSGGNVNYVAPLIMAGGMAIFGETLLVARMMAVLCGFISLLILHLVMNELKCNQWNRFIGFGLFLSISILNSTFRYVRPEFAVSLFVLLGLLFVVRYERNHNWYDIIGLAISIYFASCSHPYSLYLFALIGGSLLWNVIEKKDWKRIWHMLLLVVSAIGVVISMIYLNNILNNSLGSSGIMNRFSMMNAIEAMKVSMKHVFIKHGIYTIPFLALNLYTIVKIKNVRWIAIPNVVFVFTFPILFSTDLAMVGNSALYYSLVSIIVCCYVLDQLFDEKIHNRKQVGILIVMLLFCVLNWGVSTAFNYFKRYEKCNTILAKDIDSIVPDNSLVYGAIRFWPFKMKSTYFCDHNGKENNPSEFDYLILNSQDEYYYKDVAIVQHVVATKDRYELIYTRNTKQYGVVTIWKHL